MHCIKQAGGTADIEMVMVATDFFFLVPFIAGLCLLCLRSVPICTDILMDPCGVIKYVDFGAAKIIANNPRTIVRTGKNRTMRSLRNLDNGKKEPMHSLQGTPMYMSPESIKPELMRGVPKSKMGAMDIWSVGCVVLECVTGERPWKLDNEWAIMYHIGLAEEHPPLPEPGQLSPLGIDFIAQCLTIDPNDRPSAEELRAHPWMINFMEENAREAELEDMEEQNNASYLTPNTPNTPSSSNFTPSFSSFSEGSGGDAAPWPGVAEAGAGNLNVSTTSMSLTPGLTASINSNSALAPGPVSTTPSAPVTPVATPATDPANTPAGGAAALGSESDEEDIGAALSSPSGRTGTVLEDVPPPASAPAVQKPPTF